MSERDSVGFVGLGVMGAPMAGHLLKTKRNVIVWNRTPSKTEAPRGQGCQVASTLAELAASCREIMICVNRSEDVAECLEAMIPHAQKDTLFVDHSTISSTAAQRLHEKLAGHGLRFVDAPITGGSVGAQNGTLTIFCGGSEEDIQRARPLLDCYAKRMERVGGPGAGQMAKMANQIAVGGALLALCESLSFAKKAGLDIAQIRSLVGGGAGGSWAFENYGPMILAQDWTPGFSVKNQRKDFGYCFDSADSVQAAVPCTRLVDSLLARLEEEGHSEWTTAALYEIMLRMDPNE